MFVKANNADLPKTLILLGENGVKDGRALCS
jgi:hypothetical protein